eukprot:TRINITY_DN25732_c0_g1_i1.p1 TRINITY_DN25732_c0_g1~~TRINITY_DN25732_c0_g1_i1.p1  ORF type:complete len:462 (+),score=64.41 TRINITY_DN25732_c0_g1_i1:66-1388(+)
MTAEAGVADRLHHFKTLFETSPKVQVRYSPEKGVCVFAASSISEGDVIFGEDPEGAFQWRTQPLACEHCATLLASMDYQMKLLADPAARPTDELAKSDKLPAIDPSEGMLAEARKGWAVWRPEAWYCSEACEAAHRKDFGMLLGKEEQVRRFVEHSIECKTPFFAIALKVLIKGSGLLSNLLRKPYWECVDLSEDDPESQIEEMKADLSTSWELLRKLDIPCMPATKDEYACVVGSLCLNAVAVKYAHPLIFYIQEVDQGRGGPEAKQELIPMLERVRQERLRRAEAVRAAAAADEADSGTESDGADSESDLEDDALDFSWKRSGSSGSFDFSSKLFPPMKGYGLFQRLSALNHSCDPGAEVVFPGSSRLLVVARRNIAVGEEICISYIDHEEEDRAERQKDLNSYGFVCDCRRCKPVKKRKVLSLASKTKRVAVKKAGQ